MAQQYKEIKIKRDDDDDENHNEEKIDLDFNYEDDRIKRCLKIANPIVLALAVSVMFTIVFCIIYYGTLNSRGLINPKTATESPDLTPVTMITGKLSIFNGVFDIIQSVLDTS